MLRTNYDTGPYRVLSIERNCTCVEPANWIKNIPLPPHIHMMLRTMTEDHNKGEIAWLGFYDEQTLRSVLPHSKDRIVLLENEVPVQSTLAFA